MIVAHISRVGEKYTVERVEVPDPPSRRVGTQDERWYEGPYIPELPDAKTMLGHHVCSWCGENVDFPGECSLCLHFIDWPIEGYEDFDRSVGF